MDEIEKSFFEQLYHSYVKLMFSQAMRYINNKDDAEDIVQEALEKLLRKYGVLMTLDEKALATYIVYTVRSTAINHLKHNSKKQQWVEYDDIMLTTPNPEDLFFATLRIEEILAAWEQLSVEDRILLAQKYFLGLTIEELANSNNCSLVNIRVRLYRARKKMKMLLSNNKGE